MQECPPGNGAIEFGRVRPAVALLAEFAVQVAGNVLVPLLHDWVIQGPIARSLLPSPASKVGEVATKFIARQPLDLQYTIPLQRVN